MNISVLLKNNKYLVFALLFAALNALAIFLIFGFRQYGDTSGYINAIHWFLGKNIIVNPWIILRPLGPLIASPFEFLGEGAGLIVQNIVFYLFSAVLVFKITELVFSNKKQALFASLFFITATQVLEVGLAYLTDMGAWFFYLLSTFLTLFYFKNRNEKLIVLNGFLSGMGVLMKENGGLGILFFAMMVVLSREFNLREKISRILRFGIFFFIPIVLLQIFMYQNFGVTTLDWYLYQLRGFGQGEGIFLVILRYFGQLFRTLGFLWIFFFIGLWQELRERNLERLKIYLALLPASLSFFLWPISAGGRSVFIFAPLGILLAVNGFKKIRPVFLVIIFLAVLIVNYWFVSVNQQIAFIDLIYTSIFSR